MSLFSKLKDYNIELDEILDQKVFSSNIKNLLLSMIYKVEISYPDYKEVKKCVRKKEDFLNEIAEIIRLYCDNMKLVEPDSDQAKMLTKHKVKAVTNEKERSILSYPTEIALLYAILEISPKYYYINDSYPLKRNLQLLLANGFIQDGVEIISDFTGWSWDKTYDISYNFVDTLVYQSFLILFGSAFLTEWRTYNSTQRDFIGEAKKFIKFYTGNDKLFKLLNDVCYLNITNKEKEKIQQDAALLKKKYAKMQDKIKFIEDEKAKKIKLTNKLKKVDFTINNKDKLEKDLIKYNNKIDDPKKKITSMKKYQNLLIKEREKIITAIKEIDYLLKPANFLEEKKRIESILEFYNTKKTLEDAVIDFELEFLNIVEKRLNKMKTRDEIIDVIYELRYFSKLRIDKDTNISDFEDIDNAIDRVLKKAIIKLCKLGALRIISMDIDLNFDIIKYALDTKIINLEQIKLEFIKDEKGLIIMVFDKDVFEKQGRKKIEINKKTLEVKDKKRIKLFI